MSPQDKELAKAAVALYLAAKHGIPPADREDGEDLANACIGATKLFIENYYHEADNPQAVACYVYTELRLNHSRIA